MKKFLCIVISLCLILSGCGNSSDVAESSAHGNFGESKPQSESVFEQVEEPVYDDDLIEELDVSGSLDEDFYHFPLIADETGSAKEFNDEMMLLKEDIASGNQSYISGVKWQSYWNDSILSLLVELDMMDFGITNYIAFNYDLAAGVKLVPEDILVELGTSYDEFILPLRKAVSREFDGMMDNMYDIYGDDAYEANLYLRAQTLNISHLNYDKVQLFLKENMQPSAVIGFASSAGGGMEYKIVDIPFHEEGISKEVTCDFVTADLKDNNVTLTFKDTGTAGLFAYEAVEFDFPYVVMGLNGVYKDICLDFIGNSGNMYLLLLDEGGRVSVCDIFNCMMFDNTYLAAAPLEFPVDIERFEARHDDFGNSIFAIAEDGTENDMYEYIEYAKRTSFPTIANSIWCAREGPAAMTINGYTGTLYWNDENGTFAEGEIEFFGVTEFGIHYIFRINSEKGYYEGFMTVKVSTVEEQAEGSETMMIHQFAEPYLPGLTDGGYIELYPQWN